MIMLSGCCTGAIGAADAVDATAITAIAANLIIAVLPFLNNSLLQ
jgi:hypothetical protein